MSYIALYRKYRPQTFSDIVGQESTTSILRNQIKSQKISHAYIFSGTRGTGKTSAAKVFSRAINCLNPKEGEPCNECEVCKSILEGNTTDVVEMDAASNNSVENIRQIRQEVMYATIDTKYRVYIIDEAHMLTTSAFNALLKTLEEPPKNVIFILATTEKHKIPVTILSRCLRFDFNRLSEDKISSRLKYICDNENIKYEDGVCEYIAKLADGALRDGISILDRCISEMENGLKLEEIKNIVGAIDDDILNEIIKDIYNFDILNTLNNIDSIISKGKDLRQFLSDLNEKFLNLLILEKNQDKKERTINIIDKLSKLDNDLKNSTKPSILLKATMVEICNTNNKVQNNVVNTNMGTDQIDILTRKIENIEKELINLKTKKTQDNITPKVNGGEVKTNKLEDNSKDIVSDNIDYKSQIANMKQFKYSEEFKKFILQKGNIKVYSAIASTDMYFENNILAIITSNSFAYNLLNNSSNLKVIKDSFKEKYNKDICVRVGFDEKKEGKELKIEELLKKNNINYTNID